MTNTSDDKKRIDTDIATTAVQVHAQYVKDFSFENPNAPASLRPGTNRPEMDVNIVLDASKIKDETNPDLYESALTLTVKSTQDGNVLFITEIVYAALDGTFMSVSLPSPTSPPTAPPIALFKATTFFSVSDTSRFDMTPDAQRFLIIQQAPAEPLVLIDNWSESAAAPVPKRP